MNVRLVLEETGMGSQSEYKSSLRGSSYDRHGETLNSCGRSREPRSCAPSRDSISGIQAWAGVQHAPLGVNAAESPVNCQTLGVKVVLEMRACASHTVERGIAI